MAAQQQRADYGDEANDYYPEGAEGQQQEYGEEQYWEVLTIIYPKNCNDFDSITVYSLKPWSCSFK